MNKHRRPSEHEKPVVPITPMLDLTFQLLFFFITLFNPNTGNHKVEGQMDLTLPSSVTKKQTQASDPDKVDQSPKLTPDDDDTDLDITSELTVIVNTQFDGANDGKIASIFVEGRGPRESVEYKDVELTDLIAYLKKEREESPSSGIRVQGDSKLRWEMMIQVMDACHKAGFENVGFLQPEDYNLSNR